MCSKQWWETAVWHLICWHGTRHVEEGHIPQSPYGSYSYHNILVSMVTTVTIYQYAVIFNKHLMLIIAYFRLWFFFISLGSWHCNILCRAQAVKPGVRAKFGTRLAEWSHTHTLPPGFVSQGLFSFTLLPHENPEDLHLHTNQWSTFFHGAIEISKLVVKSRNFPGAYFYVLLHTSAYSCILLHTLAYPLNTLAYSCIPPEDLHLHTNQWSTFFRGAM